MRRADSGTPLVISKSKCFTHDMPTGKVHRPSGLKVMGGFADGTNHRLLRALSDQNGLLITYGMSPGLGVRGCVWLVIEVRFVKAPVCARVGGITVPVELLVL